MGDDLDHAPQLWMFGDYTIEVHSWSGYDTVTLHPVASLYVAPTDAKFDKQIEGEVVR